MSRQTRWPKYDVLGVDIDAVTMADATAYIVDWALDHERAAAYVVKPYSEFIDAAARRPELSRYLDQAELCLADGVALCWATTYRYGGPHTLLRLGQSLARLITRPASAYQFLPEKFAGANATLALLTAAEARGASVYLIGTPRDGAIARTAAVIRKRFPRLKLAGTAPGNINGSYGQELLAALEAGLDLSALAAKINAANPDIILVGMGFPLQEALMARLAPLISHGMLIGEGGTFDYQVFGGSQVRAPRRIQKIGLEWLWRLAIEPRRLGRQLAIPRLIWRVYRDKRPLGQTPPAV